MDVIQKRNTALLIAGRFVSFIGSSVQNVSIPLYIFDLTGSGAYMGIFACLSLLSMLASSPFAGVLGDRFNRKHLMVYADILRGLLVIILAILSAFSCLTIVILSAVQVVLSMFDSLFNASSAGIIPDLVENDDLHKINASRGTADSMSFIVGPLLGGIIYSQYGIYTVFLVNAVSFLISAMMELLLKYEMKVSSRPGSRLTIASTLKDIVDALRYLSGKSGIIYLFTFAMIFNFFITPVFSVFLPYAIRKTAGLSSSQYGYILTFAMVGLMIGNIVTGILFKRVGTEKLMKTGLFFMHLSLFLLGIALMPLIKKLFIIDLWSYFTVFCFIMLLFGFFNTWVNFPINVNLQKMVAAEYRSRFFSLLGLAAGMTTPLGVLLFGFVLDKIQSSHIVLAVVLISAFITVIFFVLAPRTIYLSK